MAYISSLQSFASLSLGFSVVTRKWKAFQLYQGSGRLFSCIKAVEGLSLVSKQWKGFQLYQSSGKHRVSEGNLGGLQRHLHRQGAPPPPSQSQAAEMQRRSAPATAHTLNAEQCCWCNLLLPGELQVDISKVARVHKSRWPLHGVGPKPR